MAKDTKIGWCDSTLNLQSGCDGCELRNLEAGVNRCYAGRLIDKYTEDGPRKGWPLTFEQPATFVERLDPALKWPNLRGKVRDDKPWIPDGHPRLIFLNDMGDTFTESLDLHWMRPFIPKMEQSCHTFQFLTKRPKRMLQFFDSHCAQTAERIAWNFWLGTTVTSRATVGRVAELVKLRDYTRSVLWLSLEPLWEDVTEQLEQYLDRIDWIVVGGESGTELGGPNDPKPFREEWVGNLADICSKYSVPLFVKQLGSLPHRGGRSVHYQDSHGSNWDEWDAGLRIRCFPATDLAYKRHLKSLR